MRFLVQRVSEANVMVDNNITGKIGKGYLVLIGITHTDTTTDADYLINNNITKSKTFQTVKQWVSDVANGRKESYYGWKFSKE